MNKAMALVIAIGCLVSGGCGTAQLMRGSADGGDVLLSGGYMPAMAEARMVMLEHCSGRFAYVEGDETIHFTCTERAGTELASARKRVASDL